MILPNAAGGSLGDSWSEWCRSEDGWHYVDDNTRDLLGIIGVCGEHFSR